MLTPLQLCSHLCYMLHAPIRLFDQRGILLSKDAYVEDQEDPVLCDPEFALDLLSRRRDSFPTFCQEEGSVIYGIIPAENGQTFLLGPVCYDRAADAASLTAARAHHLNYPHAYRIPYVPLDIILETVLLLFHACSDRPYSREELASQLMNEEDYAAEARSEAYSLIYQMRENNTAHNSYGQEVREQKAIREGNLDALKQSWAEVQTGQIGRLGKDDITHYRNLAVVVITLASRSAMEGGVLPEVAYSLADAYIMKVSELIDPLRLSNLMRSAEIHFTELVQGGTGQNVPNRYVSKCKQLIHDRLHQRITVAELAEEMGLSRSYLSQLFVEQEGLNLSAYILRAKVRASEYLLMLSDASLEQIAATFCFSSQSHYGQVFKRFNGMTPGMYRELHQNRK